MHAARLLLTLLCTVLAACGSSGAGAPPPVGAAPPDPTDPGVRIRASEARVAADPTRAALRAELGAAYLEIARETYDVAWLEKARRELRRSSELESNADAFATLASLCLFTHRFACALENAERAARLDPRDDRVRALRVDAYLGLGEPRKAEELLDQPRIESGAAFVLPAARGRWLAELKRFDAARKAFVTAAEQARGAGASERALRAEIDAGGTLIDSGRPGLARTHLQTATRMLPSSRALEALLQQRWGDLHALEQRPDEALRAYESVLERRKDPEIYRRAYVVARKAGNTARADQLFEAADTCAQRLLAAGEVLALETQARLYADAGVELERAEQLARRNLEHKRDRAAYDTLAYVREQRSKAAATPAR